MAPLATVDDVRAAFTAGLRDAASPAELQELRNRFLGRKRGAVTALLRSVAAASPDERRELGRQANALKQEIEQALAARREASAADAPAAVGDGRGTPTEEPAAGDSARPRSPPGLRVCTTGFPFSRRTAAPLFRRRCSRRHSPGREVRVGHRHPLTDPSAKEIENLHRASASRWFEGPEVEDDYHNYRGPQLATGGPARDMQAPPCISTRGRCGRAPTGPAP